MLAPDGFLTEDEVLMGYRLIRDQCEIFSFGGQCVVNHNRGMSQ